MRRRPLGLLLPVLLAAAVLASGLAGCGDGDGERRAAEGGSSAKPESAGGGAGGGRPAVSGGERIVLFGDSLAVSGGELPYPDRLGEQLARRGAEPGAVLSVAEPGSASADWAPGGALFEAAIRPELGRADVFVATVGGNDLEQALAGSSGPDAASAGLAEGGLEAASDAIAGVRRNLRRSFAAIRRADRGATIVWVGYPDYSGAASFRDAGPLASLGVGIAIGNLTETAGRAGADLTVDTTAASSRQGVEELLDGEYLNDAGHALFARRIATALTQPAAGAVAASE
jgi:lysophospholipase L1-like esterase